MALGALQTETQSSGDTQCAVQAIGLGKAIDDKVILQQLKFEIPCGRYVALLGANGAGKTTLLRMLSTLTSPTHGQLLMFGKTVTQDATELRSKLGLIGHNTMLYRDLSVRQNLMLFGRLYGLKDPAFRANELLDYVGLSHRADDAVKTFSRGMAQRAAIARALMHDPELLLADEPFAGLDAPSQEMLEQMLKELHSQGKTIIVTSHDISRSLQLTQQAIVLRNGRIVIDADTSELDAQSVLTEVRGR